MEYLKIISVPTIAMIVYWSISLIKQATNNNETFKRLIPLVSAVLGLVFGVICYYSVPEIIAADNIVNAMISGGASGLSATGCNQIIKQLSAKDEEDKDNDNSKNENHQ